MKSINSKKTNFQLPSDKSISHRLILAALLAKQEYRVKGLTVSRDIQASLDAVESLGVDVELIAPGQYLFRPAKQLPSQEITINCQNSGTTARLLLGIISGLHYPVTIKLTGDESLSKRPMKRVTGPLQMAGYNLGDRDFLPIEIKTSINRSPLVYKLEIASAQIKSALLFAGVQAQGRSILTGLIASRDHTEELLQAAGVKLDINSERIEVKGPQVLKLKGEYQIPKDPSAAAFWCLSAFLNKDEKQVKFSDILLNPSRLGFFKIISRMGAKVEHKESALFYEASGSLECIFPDSKLKSINIEEEMIPSLIDEIPILCVLMAHAKGMSSIAGVSELKFKESDRLDACIILAKAFGAEVIMKYNHLVIHSGKYENTYDFGKLADSKDHRIIMILAIISKAYDIPLELKHPKEVEVSYPHFWEALEQLE